MNGDRQRYAILTIEFLNKNALDRPQIQYMKVRLVKKNYVFQIVGIS